MAKCTRTLHRAAGLFAVPPAVACRAALHGVAAAVCTHAAAMLISARCPACCIRLEARRTVISCSCSLSALAGAGAAHVTCTGCTTCTTCTT